MIQTDMRRTPTTCGYCGRYLVSRKEWWLGRIRIRVECPRYSAWWMWMIGRADRHTMTITDTYWPS